MPDDQKIEEILSDPKYTVCPCDNGGCRFHGMCKECVALHRYCGALPACLVKFGGNE